MTALALMGLLPEGATVSGAMRFEGVDLARLGEAEMQRLRGDRIGMVFQEPMTALNPLHRVGRQVAEPLILHRGMSTARRLERRRSSCWRASGCATPSASPAPIRSRCRAASGSGR